MRVIRHSGNASPIVKPLGERVYELIGAREELGGARRQSVARIVIRPGGSTAAHRHVRTEETYYILSGTAQMEIDGQVVRIAEGDACFISPGELHQLFNAEDTELVFLAISSPPWRPEDSVFE